MRMRRYLTLACIAFCCTGVSRGQQSDKPFPVNELWWGKIKQDRVAEFGTLATRIADANRRGKGDNFIAATDFYGNEGTVYVQSSRSSMDEIEPAMTKFYGSIREYLGFSPERFAAEVSKLVDESHTELRIRRPDLSVSKDPDTSNRAFGSAKYVVSVRYNVKVGHLPGAERQFLQVKKAADSSAAVTMPVAISQSMAGKPGMTFYVLIPLASIADYGRTPSIRKVLSEEAYEQFAREFPENFESVDTRVLRVVPEWSNPPAAVVQVDPKFWNPKPAATAKPRQATEAGKPTKAGL